MTQLPRFFTKCNSSLLLSQSSPKVQLESNFSRPPTESSVTKSQQSRQATWGFGKLQSMYVCIRPQARCHWFHSLLNSFVEKNLKCRLTSTNLVDACVSDQAVTYAILVNVLQNSHFLWFIWLKSSLVIPTPSACIDMTNLTNPSR